MPLQQKTKLGVTNFYKTVLAVCRMCVKTKKNDFVIKEPKFYAGFLLTVL